MKTIFAYISLLLIISLSSCSKYLVKNRFIKKNLSLTDTDGTIDLNMKNFYILKTVKSKSNNVTNDKKEEYADITFNVFDQVIKGFPQYVYPGDSVIAEENYLYLHNIDSNEFSKGRAIYFNTYHLLYEKYQKPYLNDANYFFSGIIKELKIGYWFKVGDEISIYFESFNNSEKAIGFKGYLQQNKENNNCTYLMTKSSTVATTRKNKLGTGLSSVEEMVSRLDKTLLYVKIKNVFNLKKEEGLHFKQINPKRSFLLQNFKGKNFHSPFSKSNNPIINQIIWGKVKSSNGKKYPAIYFKTTENQYYQFKKKKNSSEKKDKKFFSILNLPLEY
ncbi:MAG: hypothetical protein AB8H03_17245 [Saprospiraceae bacterium]